MEEYVGQVYSTERTSTFYNETERNLFSEKESALNPDLDNVDKIETESA